MTNIAYKFRIYPTEDQKLLISKTFGCARFIYNTLLSVSKEQYERTKKHYINTPAKYKNTFPWLREVDSLSLCNAQINLQTAYSNFFSNVKKKRRGPSKENPYGFPAFKSKKNNHCSYTTNSINNSVRIENEKLKLPKLGLVGTVFHRRVNGKIKSVTVSRNPSGKYFVSILTEQDIPIPVVNKTNPKILGIDMSFSNFMVTSEGEKTNPPRWFYETEEKIRRASKSLSRKKIGSKNREKARLKLDCIYERMVFQRNDFLHKTSYRIVRDNDVVALEDINLSAMSRCLRFGKTVSSIAFGRFREFLAYKAKCEGKTVWYASKFFPSSQLCSVCGYRNSEVKDLSVREWICPQCGTPHDRDVNAAKNLARECRNTLASKGIQARGEVIPTDGKVSSANRFVEAGKVTGRDAVSPHLNVGAVDTEEGEVRR